MFNSIEPVMLNLQIPAKEEYIATIRSDLSILAREMGFSEEKEEDLIISVGEACVNVIRHAYKGNHSNLKMMNIRYWMYSDKIVVIVKDYGKGFDAHSVRRYLKSVDDVVLEKIGLGIFLIKSLMDEAEYESSIDKGTSVTMIKYR